MRSEPTSSRGVPAHQFLSGCDLDLLGEGTTEDAKCWSVGELLIFESGTGLLREQPLISPDIMRFDYLDRITECNIEQAGPSNISNYQYAQILPIYGPIRINLGLCHIFMGHVPICRINHMDVSTLLHDAYEILVIWMEA